MQFPGEGKSSPSKVAYLAGEPTPLQAPITQMYKTLEEKVNVQNSVNLYILVNLYLSSDITKNRGHSILC